VTDVERLVVAVREFGEALDRLKATLGEFLGDR
jgi:hypothetical protein